MSARMILELVGGLGVFLLGMKLMSESLQKVAGGRLRSVLGSLSRNRMMGVGTGIMVTAVVQSSSATTIMLVSFVNAGLLSLNQAVSVVMGANIGTTMTGWLVSILGFKIDITAMALPIVGLGFFARFIGRTRVTYWGEVLVGFGLLFLGLAFIRSAIPEVRNSPEFGQWLSGFAVTDWLSLLLAVAVGTAATIVLQSSSAAMVVVLTLAASGQIDFPTAAALILGENIGTTITAYMASVGATLAARRTARAHMLFNVLGVVWVVALFKPMLLLVDALLPGSPFSPDLAIRGSAIPSHLAAFHTVFNVLNTLLFLPLAGLLAKLTCFLVRGDDDDGRFRHLKYLDTSLVATPLMAVSAAWQEVARMMDVAREAFSKVVPLILDPVKANESAADEVQRLEEQTDIMEKEIVEYLANISRNSTSADQAAEVAGMILMASDIERIGDHCESLLKLAVRRRRKELPFSEQALEEITSIATVVAGFLTHVRNGFDQRGPDFFRDALQMENRINELRRCIRKDHVGRLHTGVCGVKQGLVFIDMLTSFEKIGDHAMNVAEALVGHKVPDSGERPSRFKRGARYRPSPET
ncbi:MAG: Na/Pi cotransporter family protein [Acidobacteriota bacterium]|nr:Na/Pi cotransporter family protein [Acidobacteriota bacterium]